MNFFSALKRTFGFGGDADQETDDILFADTAEAETPAAPAPASEAEPAADAPAAVRFDPDMQKVIFDRVLAIFNEALPDFLSRTADADAQRQYLMQAMDEGVAAYMKKLNDEAETYCEARWKQRQSTMTAELDAIRTRAGEIEKQSTDIKQKQLSADRQKRALSERVHDLEQQLSRLDSEREQFELENRSLVNRLKVANVQAEDLEKAQAEIKTLRDELTLLRDNPEAAVAAGRAEADAKIEELAAQKAELEGRVAEMTDGIESLKEQLRVSSEMQKDNRHRLGELSGQLEAKASQIESRDKRIAELEASLSELDEMLKKFKELDLLLEKKEEKIKTQKQTIAARDKEIGALKATISENMRLQAEREKTLKDEIQALRPPTVVAEMTVDFGDAAEDEAPKISEAELSAIEETFETDEWFTKTPPAETPSMRPPESDADFGYRAPRRKSTTPPPGQLSLF